MLIIDIRLALSNLDARVRKTWTYLVQIAGTGLYIRPL